MAMAEEKKKTSLQDLEVDMNPEWKSEEEENKDAELQKKLVQERKTKGRKMMQGME